MVEKRDLIGLLIIAVIVGAAIGIFASPRPQCKITKFLDIWIPEGPVLTSMQVENLGGNGYIMVDYVTNSGVLATKEYFLSSGSTGEFDEILFPNVRDRWITAEITHQSPIPLSAISHIDWTMVFWLVLIVGIAAFASTLLKRAPTGDKKRLQELEEQVQALRERTARLEGILNAVTGKDLREKKEHPDA